MPDADQHKGARRLKRVGGYELLAQLGSGGMGSVFKSRHMNSGRIVALKILPPSIAEHPEFVARFQREAKLACGLKHKNLVAGIEAGSVSNLHYYAMEFVDGDSVQDILDRDGRLSGERAASITVDVAKALAHAHSAGLIHRDIKPANILIDKQGTAKLCDLGLARAQIDRGLTQTGVAIGTPLYMSPEQIAGERDIGASADVYSLGATAYHMLTGRPPFDATTGAMVMAMHVSARLKPIRELVPDANPGVAAVIEKCLRKKPNARYSSVANLVIDLKRASAGGVPAGAGAARDRKPASRRGVPSGGELANVPSKGQGKGKSRGRGVLLAGGLLAVLAVLAVVGGLALSFDRGWAPSEGSTRGPDDRAPGEANSEQSPARELLDEMKAKADLLADGGQFDAAIAVFGDVPDEHEDEIGNEAKQLAYRMKQRADDEVDDIISKANRMFHAGGFSSALEALDEGAGIEYADSKERIARLRSTIQEAKGKVDGALASGPTVQEVLDGQVAQVVGNRYQALLATFEREVLAGDLDVARSTVDAALGDPSLERVAPELKILRSLLVQTTMLKMSGAEALKNLSKRKGPVVLKLADGKEASGKVFSVRDSKGRPTIVLHSELDGRHMMSAVKLDQLAPRTRMNLLHPAEPRTDNERLAKAIIAMRCSDLAMARALLESIRKHPLRERIAEALSKLEAVDGDGAKRPPKKD